MQTQLKKSSSKFPTKPTASLEVISCLLVQVFDSQQTSQTLINLRVTFLVGVGELLPVMSLSTSTECSSVPLPAVVQWSKEETNLNGEGCGQQKPTAALGQHLHSTVVGLTNCDESQIHSARLRSSLIFKACVRESTFGVGMMCTLGASLLKFWGIERLFFSHS